MAATGVTQSPTTCWPTGCSTGRRRRPQPDQHQRKAYLGPLNGHPLRPTSRRRSRPPPPLRSTRQVRPATTTVLARSNRHDHDASPGTPRESPSQSSSTCNGTTNSSPAPASSTCSTYSAPPPNNYSPFPARTATQPPQQSPPGTSSSAGTCRCDRGAPGGGKMCCLGLGGSVVLGRYLVDQP